MLPRLSAGGKGANCIRARGICERKNIPGIKARLPRSCKVGPAIRPAAGLFQKETAMSGSIDRREFLKLAGLGGAVFASGLAGWASKAGAKQEDFYFVQLFDTPWAFKGPAVKPDAL